MSSGLKGLKRASRCLILLLKSNEEEWGPTLSQRDGPGRWTEGGWGADEGVLTRVQSISRLDIQVCDLMFRQGRVIDGDDYI